jgi:hypothetical protein
MRILRENPNPHFDEAWQYVDRNYAHLIRESFLDAVLLLDNDHHKPDADGLHIWYAIQQADGAVRNHADITVRNDPRFSAAYFVQILVHELTHLVQHASGRYKNMTEEEVEAEAYPAGKAAQSLYELKEFEKLAQDLKTAAIKSRLMMRRA